MPLYHICLYNSFPVYTKSVGKWCCIATIHAIRWIPILRAYPPKWCPVWIRKISLVWCRMKVMRYCVISQLAPVSGCWYRSPAGSTCLQNTGQHRNLHHCAGDKGIRSKTKINGKMPAAPRTPQAPSPPCGTSRYSGFCCRSNACCPDRYVSVNKPVTAFHIAALCRQAYIAWPFHPALRRCL